MGENIRIAWVKFKVETSDNLIGGRIKIKMCHFVVPISNLVVLSA